MRLLSSDIVIPFRAGGQRIPATPAGNSKVSHQNLSRAGLSQSAQPPQTAPPIPRRSRFVQEPQNPCMKNEAGLTKPTAHPTLSACGPDPSGGPGGWVG